MEELSDQALDRMYVEENVLTNTDRFLEDHVTGSLRVWHLVLIVAGGVLVASKKLYLGFNDLCSIVMKVKLISLAQSWLQLYSIRRRWQHLSQMKHLYWLY